MVRKDFSQKLHDECDPPSRKKMIEYFASKGMKAVEHQNKYWVDLIVDDAFYCDPERRRKWFGYSFPYRTLHIPERKEKFCYLDKPMVFASLNSDYSVVMFVKEVDLLKSPLVEVPNEFVREGEMFFDVPISKVVKFRLNK